MDGWGEEREGVGRGKRCAGEGGGDPGRGDVMRTSLLWIQMILLRWTFKEQSLELEHGN
jgi:hypothetical protein